MRAALALGALLAARLGGAGDLPGGDLRAGSLAEEVLALAARGDGPSLERIAALVPDAVRTDPACVAAAANRALAGFVAAASLRERSAASSEGEAGLAKAREMREAALEEVRPLVRDHPDDPAVLRALAVYHGLGGRSAELAAVALRARAGGRSDPWIDFAEASADVRGKAPADTAASLSGFVSSHPGILPARMSLARAQLALTLRDEALATLDGLLAIDPEHEDARVLKAELLAPPPVRMAAPVVPSVAPPVSAPGYLPRKPAHRPAG